MKKFFLFLMLWITAFSVSAGLFGTKSRFLTAQEAFVFTAERGDDSLLLQWQIAPDYYLYKKEIRVEVSPGETGEVKFPAAEKHQDEFFGETDIFRQQLSIQVPVRGVTPDSRILVSYQGCTAGFCYPPESREMRFGDIPGALNSALSAGENKPAESKEEEGKSAVEKAPSFSYGQNLAQPQGKTSTAPALAEDLSARLFQTKFAVWGFFLLGLGLAFTPCVLPMLPLLSALVIGREKRPNTMRAFLLSLVYVQGMALTYTLLGLIVAAIGLPFQVALQSPYVLIGLSLIFILLSLSMFGLFDLQLPNGLQNKLYRLSESQSGGAYGSVFLMGLVAGLVASPCTSAPLSGALLYVAQSGDLLIGGLSLYLLALGMGLPLMLITLFGNGILPKSGPWLLKVKTAFGFVMLALPIFLLSRLITPLWEQALWALLATTFLLWLAFSAGKGRAAMLLRILALTAAIVAAAPLQTIVWHSATDAGLSKPDDEVFQSIASYAELQQALKNNPHGVAMLDLYADWCVACKELEKYTFSDPAVRNALKDRVLLLRADISRNSVANTELLTQLNVLGLPSLIFFDQQGIELSGTRINGFMSAAEFLNFMKEYRIISD
ncbi:protein-disulfide reductase DsbD [Mesocricetibacter intestinalis]|nr:protein-disulfide reductase DsbD [Mesocricetibacter intestinalis]